MLELWNNLLGGFATAATPINLLWALLGCTIGTAVGDVELDLQVTLDTVERSDQQAGRHFHLVRRMAGFSTRWSATALCFTRLGVALLDSEASATNQALGMSVGRPMGMPASLGVS